MISVLLFVVCAAVAGIQGMPQMPPYSHGTISDAHRDSIETLRTKSFMEPSAICTLDELVAIVGIRELQELVENLAIRKGVNPYVIVSRLMEKMKKRQEMEESFLNTLEGAALQQLLKPAHSARPMRLPPSSSGTAYGYSTTHQENDESDSPIYVIPVSKSYQTMSNSILSLPQSEHKLKNGEPINFMTDRGGGNRAFGGKNTNYFPAVYPFMGPNSRSFKPPVGVTVRVSSSHLSANLPDITFPVSPLMTVVEALRQAETRYQSVLGISAGNQIIQFSRSPDIDCFVIKEIDEVAKNDVSVWKVEIADKEGQIIYDDICVPDEKRVQVKPGTSITLSYVRL